MTIVGEDYASLCLWRQARAWGVMAMSSPRVDEEGPVRMETLASAAAGPTVGANYHHGEQTDAIGWLKLEPMDADGTGEEWCVELRTRKTQAHTRFTQVQGPRKEVKPLLLLVRVYIYENPGYRGAPRAVFAKLCEFSFMSSRARERRREAHT